MGGKFIKNVNLQQKIETLEFPLTLNYFNARGKFIYANLGVHTYFFITLGMSGSFGNQNKHSALEFEFNNGKIYYNDIRHFGTFKIINDQQQLADKLNSLGWDCYLDQKIPNNYLNSVRKHNHKRIAEVCLDQSVFAGMGNYLRAEVLYAAKINPFSLVKDLSDEQLYLIGENYQRVVQEALKVGGATLSTYSDMYGIAGEFYKQFKVYGQKLDPNGFQVIRQPDKNNRTMHWVKEIQG